MKFGFYSVLGYSLLSVCITLQDLSAQGLEQVFKHQGAFNSDFGFSVAAPKGTTTRFGPLTTPTEHCMAVSAPRENGTTGSILTRAQNGSVYLLSLTSTLPNGLPSPCGQLRPPVPSSNLFFGHSLELVKTSPTSTSLTLLVGAPASGTNTESAVYGYTDPFQTNATPTFTIQGAVGSNFGLKISQHPDVVWRGQVGEIIIAAPASGGNNSKIYLINPNELPSSGTLWLSNLKYLVYPGASENFGDAIEYGDFSGDGTIDLAVGNRADDSSSGIVFYDGAAISSYLQSTATSTGLQPTTVITESSIPGIATRLSFSSSTWFGDSMATYHDTTFDTLFVGAPWTGDGALEPSPLGAVAIFRKGANNLPTIVPNGIVYGTTPNYLFGDDIHVSSNGILSVGAPSANLAVAGQVFSIDAAAVESQFSGVINYSTAHAFTNPLHRYTPTWGQQMDSFYGTTVTKIKYPTHATLSTLSGAYSTTMQNQSELPYTSLFNTRSVPSVGVGCNLPGQSLPLSLSGSREPTSGSINLTLSGVPVIGTQPLVLYADYLVDPTRPPLTIPGVFGPGCEVLHLFSFDFINFSLFPNFPLQSLPQGLRKYIVAIAMDPNTQLYYTSNALDVSTTNF